MLSCRQERTIHDLCDEDNESKKFLENETAHSGPILSRQGYFTEPPINVMQYYAQKWKVFAENLKVGRDGFGMITFLGITDVSNLNLDEIVEISRNQVIVYPEDNLKPDLGMGLNRKALVTLEGVWPIDKITKLFIKDPERIVAMGFVRKLTVANEQMSSKFLNYDPVTGSWTFFVEHFSKYGFYDSEEEEEKSTEKTPVPKPHAPSSEVISINSNVEAASVNISRKEQVEPAAEDMRPTKESISLRSVPVSSESNREVGCITFIDLNTEVPMVSTLRREQSSEAGGIIRPTEELVNVGSLPASSGSNRGVEFLEPDLKTTNNEEFQRAGKLFWMKRSFFGKVEGTEEKELLTSSEITKTERPFRIIDTEKNKLSQDISVVTKSREHSPQSRKAVLTELSRIKRECCDSEDKWKDWSSFLNSVSRSEHANTYEAHVVHNVSLTIPFLNTTASGLKSASFDIGLFKGYCFRVGWGPRCTFLVQKIQRSKSAIHPRQNFLGVGSRAQRVSGQKTYGRIIQKIRLQDRQAEDCTMLGESLQSHLQIELRKSEFYESNQVPGVKPIPGIQTISKHCYVTYSTDREGPESKYSKTVFGLVNALWGLPVNDWSVNSHQNIMARKERLSLWLQAAVRSTVLRKANKELVFIGPCMPAIWTLLTGNLVHEACKLSEQQRDYYTTLLISQLGSSAFVNYLIREQIFLWVQTASDCYIDENRMKVFLLMSRIPVLTNEGNVINVCNDLDWKRAFGIHLWYMTAEVGSIKDAVRKYDKAWQSKSNMKYAREPLPHYLEDEQEEEASYCYRDLCYHMLQLYCDRYYRLEQLLNPATYSRDPLDYQLSWMIWRIVSSLGYRHISEYATSKVHTLFALQLEAYGEWEWAMFSLLHLKNDLLRKKALTEILERNIRIHGDSEYNKKEEFVICKLQIPENWVLRIKSGKAMQDGNYDLAIQYLLIIEDWPLAHSVIIHHLATTLIATENFNCLYFILKPIVETEGFRTILDWNYQGKILWDFLCISRSINKIDGFETERFSARLRSDVISLCNRLQTFKETTRDHRLLKYYIAKHMIQSLPKAGNILKDRLLWCHILLLVSTRLPLQDNFTSGELKSLIQIPLNDESEDVLLGYTIS